MWLVYLRFEGSARTKGGHVTCGNKQEADQLLERAKRPDASFPGSKLVEYAFFYCRGTIKLKVAPTSPEPVFADSAS